MLDQSPDAVTRVTCIGAGPIGGGWAAHFLARGYHVTSYLHDAAEHDALMRLLETAWTSLEEITGSFPFVKAYNRSIKWLIYKLIKFVLLQ